VPYLGIKRRAAQNKRYTNRLPLPLPFTGWVIGMTNKIPVPFIPKGSFLKHEGKLANSGALGKWSKAVESTQNTEKRQAKTNKLVPVKRNHFIYSAFQFQ